MTDHGDSWRLALQAVLNLVASRLRKSKDDPDVKDVAALALYLFLKCEEDKDPIEHLALLFDWTNTAIKRHNNPKAKQNKDKPSFIPVDEFEAEEVWGQAPDLNIDRLDAEAMADLVCRDEKDRVILDLISKGFSQETVGDVLRLHQTSVARRLARMHKQTKKLSDQS